MVHAESISNRLMKNTEVFLTFTTSVL